MFENWVVLSLMVFYACLAGFICLVTKADRVLCCSLERHSGQAIFCCAKTNQVRL